MTILRDVLHLAVLLLLAVAATDPQSPSTPHDWTAFGGAGGASPTNRTAGRAVFIPIPRSATTENPSKGATR